MVQDEEENGTGDGQSWVGNGQDNVPQGFALVALRRNALSILSGCTLIYLTDKKHSGCSNTTASMYSRSQGGQGPTYLELKAASEHQRTGAGSDLCLSRIASHSTEHLNRVGYHYSTATFTWGPRLDCATTQCVVQLMEGKPNAKVHSKAGGEGRHGHSTYVRLGLGFHVGRCAVERGTQARKEDGPSSSSSSPIVPSPSHLSSHPSPFVVRQPVQLSLSSPSFPE
nr:uncharacterized protein CTRU02_12508 [Colletotrichum truncatum]KAF6784519.1 hypothetical protein CTRU02_12508 [Colletotrichum truncatum]